MSGHRQLVSSGSPWEGPVGYSRAVRAGSMVFVAGTTAARPGAAPVGGDDAHQQAAEALRRIAAALHQVGAGMDDVVRTRICVTDITTWPDVARAHGEVFATIRPAATMVQVAALIEPALLVEIEADAVLAPPSHHLRAPGQQEAPNPVEALPARVSRWWGGRRGAPQGDDRWEPGPPGRGRPGERRGVAVRVTAAGARRVWR